MTWCHYPWFTLYVKGTILIERPRSIIKIWSNNRSNDLKFVMWPVNDLKNRLNLTNIVITNLISLLDVQKVLRNAVYSMHWKAKNGDHAETICFKHRNNRPEPVDLIHLIYTLFFIFNKLDIFKPLQNKSRQPVGKIAKKCELMKKIKMYAIFWVVD